jgi:hypothetical protein
MNTKGIGHAIAGIEKELENLKAHAGLAMDTGEEEDYPIPSKTRDVGRGRKKKTVPSIAEELEEE